MKINSSLIIFILFANISQAQSLENFVKGRVVDMESGKPLPSVNVFCSGTAIGTVTDNEGKFILKSIYPAELELVVSMIGYAPEKKLLQVLSTSKLSLMLLN